MKDLLKLYKQLHSITKEQQKLIEKRDFDRLFQVLQDKDELIEQIDQRDLELFLTRQEDPKKVYNKIKEVMIKTKTLEEKNIDNLQEKSSDIKDKMQQLNKKENTRKGYNSPNSYEAKFIDKKS
jgi:vacuolar-type H+-ATPase subunit I/STV1